METIKFNQSLLFSNLYKKLSNFVIYKALSVLVIFASVSAFSQTNSIAKTDLTAEQMTKIVNEHFEVLNIQNSGKRLVAMDGIYTKDFHITDTYFEFFNYKDWNNTVNEIHKKFPGEKFEIVNKVETLHNVARVSWKLGKSLLGQNFFIFEKGKVKEILAFVGPADGSAVGKADVRYAEVVKKHFEVLNIQDPVVRLKEMSKVYTLDFHIVDSFFEYFNYEDWNKTVDVIHQKFPGQNFSITNEIKTIPGVANSTWKLGNDLVGQNIFIFKDGKVKTIIAFVQQISDKH